MVDINKQKEHNPALTFFEFKRGNLSKETLIESIQTSYLPTEEIINAFEQNQKIEIEDTAKVMFIDKTKELIEKFQNNDISREEIINLYDEYIEDFINQQIALKSTFIRSQEIISASQKDNRSKFQKILDSKNRKN